MLEAYEKTRGSAFPDALSAASLGIMSAAFLVNAFNFAQEYPRYTVRVEAEGCAGRETVATAREPVYLPLDYCREMVEGELDSESDSP